MPGAVRRLSVLTGSLTYYYGFLETARDNRSRITSYYGFIALSAYRLLWRLKT